jgi:hypothetical protein
MERVRVRYHGHIFDASGYGDAARAYIHAMHAVGVELSVTNLSKGTAEVRDDLVESLVDRPLQPDFNLFHGIPHTWARQAFRVSNAIAMTVWETDAAPTQWCNSLNHALEIWLPCDFNLAAFRLHVRKPLAKVPHPVLPRRNVMRPFNGAEFLNVRSEDFVFYGIFEWQERKSPKELIECYLKAFPATENTLLILKLNPDAVSEAARTLEQARIEYRSSARVDLRCESWDETRIVALHERGNCYVSLHRGEGWCYPLFEAACHGIPVVATAYAGPLEYLDAEHHQLVSYRLGPVRQQYAFYRLGMRWAEPDVDEATRRLRWVYENRDKAKRMAIEASWCLQERYSIEKIGEVILARLSNLLRRTRPSRWEEIHTLPSVTHPCPSLPISGDWYDEDYFEFGVKSNWSTGYHWASFGALFHEIATYVTTVFANSESFLDAGCAKGFLVKALRALGKQAWGFDISPWAIANAEADVRRYIQLAAAEEVRYDCKFDALLAFDLLDHLTEAQIHSFLCNARAWTRVGLLAVIPTYDRPDAEFAEDNDHSRVARQTRLWWHERFLECGWRQDPLHRALQHLCQAHQLPMRMGWSIYLYSPHDQ